MDTIIHTIPGRDFNQDVGAAKRAAADGPVLITDRGHPAFVLMNYATWDRLSGLSGPPRSILDSLDLPGVADIEFDPPRLADGIYRPAPLFEG